MSTTDVIESYLQDVMRRLPRKERNEVGLELRGLLEEMLADRAAAEGKPANDALVLAMLHEFGTPGEVAARYRTPGMVIIPADQTRTFVLSAVIGLVLQWALTLPRVFDQQPWVAWWFSWGLGAFWWPGFLVMMMLLAAAVRQRVAPKPAWQPKVVDPDRVSRGAMTLALAGIGVGAALMIALPFIAPLLPAPVAQAFVFDPQFLRSRAWLVIPLWFAAFATFWAALRAGRWTPRLRRIEIGTSLVFLALLVWWMTGRIFAAAAADDTARGALGLVLLIIAIDLAVRVYRRGTRIRVPTLAH